MINLVRFYIGAESSPRRHSLTLTCTHTHTRATQRTNQKLFLHSLSLGWRDSRYVCKYLSITLARSGGSKSLLYAYLFAAVMVRSRVARKSDDKRRRRRQWWRQRRWRRHTTEFRNLIWMEMRVCVGSGKQRRDVMQTADGMRRHPFESGNKSFYRCARFGFTTAPKTEQISKKNLCRLHYAHDVRARFGPSEGFFVLFRRSSFGGVYSSSYNRVLRNSIFIRFVYSNICHFGMINVPSAWVSEPWMA